MSLLSSQRDDRRRRALAEESAGENAALAGSAASSLKPAGKAERYTAAARPENHRRVSQLLPTSNLSLALWFLAGLTMVAGLLVGHAFMADLAIAEGGVVPLLNVAAGNSLAGWFSAVLLLTATVGSVFIYSLRRHKLDDYRGSYRLWLWSAAAWLVMSLDAVANLRAPFAQGLALATGWTLNGNASVWWIGTWGILLSIVALRLVLEIRDSTGALSALVLTLIMWVAALASDCGWVAIGAHAVIVAAGARLIGQLSLLLSIALYSRYVQLDVQGLVAVRPAKPKKIKAKKTPPLTNSEEAKSKSTGDGKSLKLDASHTASDKRTDLQPHGTSGNGRGGAASGSSFATSKPASSSFAANRSSRDDDEDDDDDRSSSYNSSARYDEEDDDEGDDDGDGGNRKLSRAERKRLRKLKKQQER